MNIKKLSLLSLLSLSLTAFAENEKTTIAQVTDAVTLTTDVDYTITGTTPFATTGSINIENTDHAVIIFQKIKPSKVIAQGLLKKIYINGEPAVAGDLTSNNATAGSNCQVKMYNRGTIIMPYGQNFRPLTCYTEADFQGDSYNDYTEGSSGGYMKTLNATNLNNKIKSFKLKRGYMVTFALGTGGWGYSRCFIADTEDLEMNLPANMSGRVSSYRLFKWWDASKAGIHDTSVACNDALNTTSCFDWAQGNASLLPDVEWVPNHIYEDWPSSATCGGVTGSCHMKTNNEPGNSADDHPQTVETVLNNWQNLMRTGMRLCSESSHDGSMKHLKEFITEIDARGWRCDILDIHSYWTGQFYNFDWYRSEYGNGRPIWISEWVYGSSWGNAGIFNNPPDGRDSYSTANQQKNYDYVKPILDVLNGKGYIERYFYWNSEANCSKIYKDGQISILGKYYAQMETGLAYNKKYEYVPKVVYNAPTDLVGTYAKAKGTYTLSWNDANGDMLDSLVVQVKRPGTSTYRWLGSVALKDMNAKNGSSYTFVDEPEAGASYYRIAAYPINSKTPLYSDEVSISVSSSKGTDMYQYGKFSVTNSELISTTFSDKFSSNPAVFIGPMSNKNAKLYPVSTVKGVTRQKFDYQVVPWSNGTGYVTTISSAEEVPFLAIQDTTNYKFGELDCEVGNAKIGMSDTLVVTFRKPFPEGVTPIVITNVRYSTVPSNAFNVRISNVTNTGFKAIAMYEEALTPSKITQTMSYLAITPGIGMFDEESEILIAAGQGSSIYGSVYRESNFFIGEEPVYMKNPFIFGDFQTFNYPTATIARNAGTVVFKDETSPANGAVTGAKIKRQVDATSSTTAKNDKSTADTFGWVAIANLAEGYTVPTAIRSLSSSLTSKDALKVSVINRRITVDNAPNALIYNASGAQVSTATSLSPGIYIIKSGNKTSKVIVK